VAALDAVEAGCRVVELDCPDMTVGLGSRPDRDGFVTLDAAVMTDDGRAGCVAFGQGVAHPISLARLVMEKTPHVLLAGAGAEQFARECGIEVAPPKLTPEAERQWREWLVERKYEPKVNIENHDTISMLALDAQGRMAAASTTSGLAYKMHGRIGDSPIIGAGNYADAWVAVSGTGTGEEFIRYNVARTIGARVRFGGESLEHASNEVVFNTLKKDDGGIIAVDRAGHVAAEGPRDPQMDRPQRRARG
jgi:N4-(beta-N-acetylglucosaminyl)-L-asparaginase